MSTYSKPKCPRCNGCLEEKHYAGKKLWWCFLCQVHYTLQPNGKLAIVHMKRKRTQ